MALRALIQREGVDGKWTDIGIVGLDSRNGANPFTSGSVGYYASTKLVAPSSVDGQARQFQTSVTMVEVGTKGVHTPKAK